MLAAHGLRSCGSRLESTGSIVAAYGLGCSAACGIFSDQGWNLCLLHWKVDSLPLSHQGGPVYSVKLKKKKIQSSKIEALIGFIRVIHESIGHHPI